MRTLNEQIQRLRDALVTCYNAIKRKGGTIPEAGERTLLNMPAAVLSIPQTHGVLTELNVTANGEYLPADYDVDGFSKVTAEFDTSSLPKVKQINMLRVTSSCLNADGVWEGGGVLDTSELTSFYNMFNENYLLNYVDVKSWNTDKITNMINMFNHCVNLNNLDVSNWNTGATTSMANMFFGCKSLKSLDLTNWDVSKVDSIGGIFDNCTSLIDLVGGRTIEDVLNNNISALKGLKKSIHLAYAPKNRASMRAVINGLADLTGQTPQEIVFGGNLELLEEEDLAILTEKNWTTR